MSRLLHSESHALWNLLFILVLLQGSLKAQELNYELDLEARDTIWIGKRIADEFVPLENSGGLFLVYSDSLFLCSSANCRELFLTEHHSIISPSLSIYGNSIGFYRNRRFHVFDVEQNRMVASFKPDRDYNALINSSHQDSSSIILINHYPNDYFEDLGHDKLKLYKYSKAEQKVSAKSLINIGPEVLLAALNFQLHAFSKSNIYIGLPLSGHVLVVDKGHLGLKDTLLPKNLMSDERQAFFKTFLSGEKMEGYRNQSKRLIGDYYQSIDSGTSVLSKVIYYSEEELLLVYKNPLSHRPSLFLFKLKDRTLHKVDTRNYYSNPLFASRKAFVNEQGQLELCHLETTKDGAAYFIINKYAVKLRKPKSPTISEIWSDKTLWPQANTFKYFVLIEANSFCSGCFAPEEQDKTLFIASEKLLEQKGVSPEYLANYYRRLFKITGHLSFVPDDIYRALCEYYSVNTRLQKTSDF